MKAIDKLKESIGVFKDSGFESPEREAELLLRHGAGISTVEIYRDNPELSMEQLRTIENLLRRRLGHEPIQYVLGYTEFFGLKLMLGPGVLIPRPETEFIVEEAIKAVKFYRSYMTYRTYQSQDSPLSILDLCTGSGCVALALAKGLPDSNVCGTDISDIAIEYANLNAEINGIKNAAFLKGNLFEPIERLFTVQCSPFTFDLIISNPPYIRRDDMKNLQPEIREWEPVIALDGGHDGLDLYRELIPGARHFLKKEGLVIVEVGSEQSCDVVNIFESCGYSGIEIIKDLAGMGRIVRASWNNS